MVTTANVQSWGKSRDRRSIDGYFLRAGEPPLGNDELTLARFAFSARYHEVRVAFGPMIVAYVALGIAVMTVTSFPVWQAVTFLLLGTVGVWVSLLLTARAGHAAAVHAVFEHRQAVKLATRPAAMTAPKPPARVVLTASTAAVVTGAAALVAVTLRRRR